MLRGDFDTTNLCNTHWVLRSMSKNTFVCKLVSLEIKNNNCAICCSTASTLSTFTITRQIHFISALNAKVSACIFNARRTFMNNL